MPVAYIVLYLLAAFEIIHSYELLPAQVATHFTMQGNADRWMPQAAFIRFHFGFIFFISAIFWMTGFLVGRLPARYLSIPNREYWLAPQRLEDTRKKLGNLIAAMGLVAGFGVMVIDGIIIEVNTEPGTSMDATDFTPVIIGMSAAVAVLIVAGARSFRLPAKTPPEA